MAAPPLFAPSRQITEVIRGVYHVSGWWDFVEQSDWLRKIKRKLVASMNHAGMRELERPMTAGGLPMSVRIFCWGYWWTIRGYQPPRANMPVAFRKLADAVLAETAPEWVGRWTPQTAILNWYGSEARLGEHIDKQEAVECVTSGSPIVTFAWGDDCDFTVRMSELDDKRKFRMRSGDVVVLAGLGRTALHSVARIHPGTSPIDCQGRVSITMRQVKA